MLLTGGICGKKIFMVSQNVTQNGGTENITLSLNKEPNNIFYKDEGGKSNFLSATCLVKSSTSSKTFPIGNLKLCPRLVYESGAEIEDEEEIFNVLSVDPKTITSTNEIFTVNFRVEKVSRRKDGKRFKVRFDINKDSSHLLNYVSVAGTRCIETQAITVLSKRKNNHGNHQNNSQIQVKEEHKLKRRKTSQSEPEKQKEISLPLNFFLKLKESIGLLEENVRALNERVAVLERKNITPGSPLRSAQNAPTLQTNTNTLFSRGQRVHSLMFDQLEELTNCRDHVGSNGGSIKRNASSTTELFELLASPQVLN